MKNTIYFGLLIGSLLNVNLASFNKYANDQQSCNFHLIRKREDKKASTCFWVDGLRDTSLEECKQLACLKNANIINWNSSSRSCQIRKCEKHKELDDWDFQERYSMAQEVYSIPYPGSHKCGQRHYVNRMNIESNSSSQCTHIAPHPHITSLTQCMEQACEDNANVFNYRGKSYSNYECYTKRCSHIHSTGDYDFMLSKGNGPYYIYALTLEPIEVTTETPTTTTTKETTSGYINTTESIHLSTYDAALETTQGHINIDATNNTITTSPTGVPTKSNITAIVGAVIGILLLVIAALIIFIIIICRRRKKRHNQPTNSDKHTLSNNSSHSDERVEHVYLNDSESTNPNETVVHNYEDIALDDGAHNEANPKSNIRLSNLYSNVDLNSKSKHTKIQADKETPYAVSPLKDVNSAHDNVNSVHDMLGQFPNMKTNSIYSISSDDDPQLQI
ncbi:unnamed protein product, partial [Owenia fusiformis]